MKVVSGFSFADWCPAVGTCRLLCLWSIMRGNGWRKRGQQWEHREDARGFMCNGCLQNWPLCSMSFVSNFLKNIPFLQCVFMIMLLERCWKKITWCTRNKWRHICKCCRSFMKISPPGEAVFTWIASHQSPLWKQTFFFNCKCLFYSIT